MSYILYQNSTNIFLTAYIAKNQLYHFIILNIIYIKRQINYLFDIPSDYATNSIINRPKTVLLRIHWRNDNYSKLFSIFAPIIYK